MKQIFQIFALLFVFFRLNAQNIDSFDIVTNYGTEIHFVERQNQDIQNIVINNSNISFEGLDYYDVIYTLKDWVSFQKNDTYSYINFTPTDNMELHTGLLVGNPWNLFAKNSGNISIDSFKLDVLAHFLDISKIGINVEYNPAFKFGINTNDPNFFKVNEVVNLDEEALLKGNNTYSFTRKTFNNNTIDLDEYKLKDLAFFLLREYKMHPIFDENIDIFGERVLKNKISFQKDWTPQQVIDYLADYGYLISRDSSIADQKLIIFTKTN